jgi:transcription elongation factor GreA
MMGHDDDASQDDSLQDDDDDNAGGQGDDDDGRGSSSAKKGDGDDPAQTVEEEEILVTKEGLKKLKEELEELKSVKRQEIAERLKEAISYGDLSENAEYEEAKNEQAFIEGRILELEKKIKNAKIISEKHDGRSKLVEIGSQVTVSEKGGRSEPETYMIVGSTEANPIEYKISNESPIGKALLGRMRGDTVEVQAPGGRYKYEILKIS